VHRTIPRGIQRLRLPLVVIVLMATSTLAQTGTTIAGRISHPDGTPAPDAPVFAAVPGRNGQLREVASAVSGWDGQYRLTGLGAGEYVIGARLNARAPVTFYPGTASVDERRTVTVFDRIPAGGIDIWLEPLPQRYTVAGRIYWPEGRTIDNLAIEYGAPANPRMGIWYVFDPGGLFAIDGAPPGTMVLLARADSDAGPLIGIASTHVSVSEVDDIRIDLERPGSVEGRVLFTAPRPPSAEPRVALTHALLRVSPLYPVEDGAIDAAGRFRIAHARGHYTFAVSGLPEGWRVLRVRRNSREVPGGRVIVGAAEQVSGLELEVGPAR
jgi:hypothetical protein